MTRDSKRKLGKALTYLGLTGMIYQYIMPAIRMRRFQKAVEEATKSKELFTEIPSDSYSLNKKDAKKPSVFTDTDAAMTALYPKASWLRKMFLKSTIKNRIQNPQYHPDINSVFIDKKYLGTKILAHELGHANDTELKNIKRSPLHYKNFFNGFINPDNSDILKSEIKAWDLGKVPKGDKVREAALDTYRGHLRDTSFHNAILLPLMLTGGYLTLKNR